jgi:hypothetical protein
MEAGRYGLDAYSTGCLSTVRDESAVHAAIEPSYIRVFLLPSTSLRANQAIEAQWPVLQNMMLSSSAPRPTPAASVSTVPGPAKRPYSAL